jgi:hypothetical protein
MPICDDLISNHDPSEIENNIVDVLRRLYGEHRLRFSQIFKKKIDI